MAKPSAICFVVFSLLLGGCTKAVRIIDPDPAAKTQPLAPILSFTVKFAPLFAPGSFRAELDGQDVTQQFMPAAAAGGTSKMNMPDNPGAFTGGTAVNVGGGARSLGAVGSLPPNLGPVTPGEGGRGAPGGGGSPGGGSSSARPGFPNQTVFTHTLHVSAQCYGMICETTDDLVFLPIQLAGLPPGLNVRIGDTALLSVQTDRVLSKGFLVNVRPLTPSVSLEGQQTGHAVIVAVPTSGVSAPIHVTGKVSANLSLILEARGVQTGSVTGTVNP